MPIGEDIPMLIPIAIVITIFVMFLISLFINFSDRNEVIRMSEAALNVGDLSTNVLFASDFGTVNQTKLEKLGYTQHCMDLSKLNISVNYQTHINISKTNSTDWWCWDNTNSYSKKPKTEIKKMIPIIITNSTDASAARLEVTIGK
jgi:hypothetical protein